MRKLEEIQQEYANKAAEAGNKEYLIFIKQAEIKKLEYEKEKILNHMQTLNNEADNVIKAKKVEDEAQQNSEAV